jgi:large subunit ribosomal protein L29
MRADEIREMTDADIRTRVAELEEERFRLKFRSGTETLEDPLRLRVIRKDIERLKTVLRERELAAAAGKRGAPGAGKRGAPGAGRTGAARGAKTGAAGAAKNG